MLEPQGNYNVLVIPVYPDRMERFRFRLHVKISGVRFANMPARETTFGWLRKVTAELRRLSGWRLRFDQLAVTDWRPITGPPSDRLWHRLVAETIGEANPPGYDAVVVVRPSRTGIQAWDELGLGVLGLIPAGFADSDQRRYHAVVVDSAGLSPLCHPGWDVKLGVHEIGHLFGLPDHNKEEDRETVCAMGKGWGTDLCPACRAQLGWP